MSGIVLSASVRQNLLSLQSTASLLATTQNRLATGKKVNSALDNPTNFFTAQGLDNRASDISNLLDGIGNGIQVLQAANTGITSLQKLVDSAKSIASQVLQSPVGYVPRSGVTSTAIAGATATNLLGSLTNATALLWRLDTLGCDIGDRWPEQADLWQEHADGKCLVFADIHAAMAELRSGREALVERRLEAMRETAASSLEAAALYRTVGIPVVEGLRAFHRGAYAEAVESLLPVRVDLWQIGGSHAQRDIVDWTLTEAALRAGQRDVALSLAYERLAARPRSAPNRRFLRNAEAIATCGLTQIYPSSLFSLISANNNSQEPDPNPRKP